MRLILISACTLAFYAGPAVAQDAQQQDSAAMEQQISNQSVNYAADSSNTDRARNYARDAQRMMRERADNENDEEAPLPIGDAVIVDDNRRSNPDN